MHGLKFTASHSQGTLCITASHHQPAYEVLKNTPVFNAKLTATCWCPQCIFENVCTAHHQPTCSSSLITCLIQRRLSTRLLDDQHSARPNLRVSVKHGAFDVSLLHRISSAEKEASWWGICGCRHNRQMSGMLRLMVQLDNAVFCTTACASTQTAKDAIRPHPA